MTEKEKEMAYDKAIRKSLIALLKHFCNGYRIPWLNPPVSYKEMLDWLEKQDEQTLPQTNSSNTEEINKKSTDEIKPKFKVGDWIVFVKSGSTYQVEKIENYEYTLRHVFGGLLCLPFSNEKLIREWTIQDAKDGDILATSAGAFIYNGNDGGGSCPGSYCGINTLGNLQKGTEHHWTGKKVYPATKEQRDILYQKIKERKEKFDPKTLKPFDKVLVRDSGTSTWRCTFYSHTREDGSRWKYVTDNSAYEYCIPYNDDTKHLVGTTEEAPEYYTY